MDKYHICDRVTCLFSHNTDSLLVYLNYLIIYSKAELQSSRIANNLDPFEKKIFELNN